MSKKFELALALHCSPALFGIKPANLINLSLDEVPTLFEEINELNSKFSPRICFRILMEKNNRVLVLVYQELKLYNSLFNNDNYNYLLTHNYPQEKNIDSYLSLLSSRMCRKSFPHEIGVFLGYDLNDIKEYQKGNNNCVYVGYWKVFSNKEEKIKIFDKYTKCKNTVSNLLNKGYSLEALI